MSTPGNKLYEIEYLDTLVEKDIPALPKSAKILIKNAIEERLTIDPIGYLVNHSDILSKGFVDCECLHIALFIV